jgi:hypothetical protein
MVASVGRGVPPGGLNSGGVHPVAKRDSGSRRTSGPRHGSFRTAEDVAAEALAAAAAAAAAAEAAAGAEADSSDEEAVAAATAAHEALRVRSACAVLTRLQSLLSTGQPWFAFCPTLPAPF